MRPLKIFLLFVLSFASFSSFAVIENSCKDTNSNGVYTFVHYSDTNYVKFSVSKDSQNFFSKKLEPKEFSQVVMQLMRTGEKSFEDVDFTITLKENSFSFFVDGIEFIDCFKF